MSGPVLLVWNGCDGYIETSEAVHYKGAQEFRAFPVLPASLEDVPLNSDGELDFTGFYLTDAGNVYRDV